MRTWLSPDSFTLCRSLRKRASVSQQLGTPNQVSGQRRINQNGGFHSNSTSNIWERHFSYDSNSDLFSCHTCRTMPTNAGKLWHTHLSCLSNTTYTAALCYGDRVPPNGTSLWFHKLSTYSRDIFNLVPECGNEMRILPGGSSCWSGCVTSWKSFVYLDKDKRNLAKDGALELLKKTLKMSVWLYPIVSRWVHHLLMRQHRSHKLRQQASLVIRLSIHRNDLESKPYCVRALHGQA